MQNPYLEEQRRELREKRAAEPETPQQAWLANRDDARRHLFHDGDTYRCAKREPAPTVASCKADMEAPVSRDIWTFRLEQFRENGVDIYRIREVATGAQVEAGQR